MYSTRFSIIAGFRILHAIRFTLSGPTTCSQTLNSPKAYEVIYLRKGHSNKHHVDIMPTQDYKNKRLNREEARKLVTKLSSAGRVILTNHARLRLLERHIILNDVINVLLSPSMRITDGEFEKGSYTYRCYTSKFTVVIGFTVIGDSVVVITVFKTERKT